MKHFLARNKGALRLLQPAVVLQREASVAPGIFLGEQHRSIPSSPPVVRCNQSVARGSRARPRRGGWQLSLSLSSYGAAPAPLGDRARGRGCSRCLPVLVVGNHPWRRAAGLGSTRSRGGTVGCPGLGGSLVWGGGGGGGGRVLHLVVTGPAEALQRRRPSASRATGRQERSFPPKRCLSVGWPPPLQRIQELAVLRFEIRVYF